MRFFLFASSVVFVGCNALLGIESASFDPPLDAAVVDSHVGDAAPGTDAHVADGSSSDDAATNDVNPPDVVDGGRGDADADADAGEVCTKDCLGGACVDGKCQPFTVIDLGTQTLNGLTAAGDDVYWTNATKRQLQTAAGRAAATSSVVLALPNTNAFNEGDISSDATHVYFAEENASDDANITYRVARIKQTERSAADDTVETIADSLPVGPLDVIAEGQTNIVWNEFAAGRVLRCGSVPCSLPDVVATGEDFPGHLSARGGRIAWGTLMKEVRFRPTGGGATTTIATAQSFVGTVLITSMAVFYSDLGHGFTAHDFSPTNDRLLSDDENVTQSALDPDGETIWYASTSGFVARVLAAGGTSEILASGLGSPRALSVGTHGVYWLETSGASHHSVMGIAK